jgi:hypothetical protein
MKKQNFFADVEDSIGKKDGFESAAWGVGFVLFIVLWIYFETFWGALIFVIIGGPTIGGLAALFIGCVSTMFARKEEEDRQDRISRFFFGLLPAIFSGAALYFLFLICS